VPDRVHQLLEGAASVAVHERLPTFPFFDAQAWVVVVVSGTKSHPVAVALLEPTELLKDTIDGLHAASSDTQPGRMTKANWSPSKASKSEY
jgi:hypothetical protein